MMNKPINLIFFFLFSLFDIEVTLFLTSPNFCLVQNLTEINFLYSRLSVLFLLSTLCYFGEVAKDGPFKCCLNKGGKFNREDSQSI